MTFSRGLVCGVWTVFVAAAAVADDGAITVGEDDSLIQIETPHLQAAVRKKGYVSGIAGGSFVDKQTGFKDLGFGLDIVDWIMESGSDRAYRDKLNPELVYRYGDDDPQFYIYHGNRAKRGLEGPQICTQAKELEPQVIRGKDFVAVKQTFAYRTAAPGKNTGSRWTQIIVIPRDARYFISMDRIDTVNDSDGMFLRLDMPGHIKHKRGDTFSEIYLSYLDKPRIGPEEFYEKFAPDAKFNYQRGVQPLPQRFIRAYKIRDPQTGKAGPWLAGMTLDPSVVSEAWCHERGYICMIEEFGGRAIKAGGSFRGAFIVGYFDSIEQMHQVYDRYKGYTGLVVDEKGWRLVK